MVGKVCKRCNVRVKENSTRKKTYKNVAMLIFNIYPDTYTHTFSGVFLQKKSTHPLKRIGEGTFFRLSLSFQFISSPQILKNDSGVSNTFKNSVSCFVNLKSPSDGKF